MKNLLKLLQKFDNKEIKLKDVYSQILYLFSSKSWINVSEKLPLDTDKDYLVIVKNKNKENGIPIFDIANFSSDGIWIKNNTWEDVVCWSELPEPPCLGAILERIS